MRRSSLLIFLAFAFPAHAYESKLLRTTPPNKAIVLAGHSSVITAGCLTKPGSVTVIQQPQHGTLSVKEGPSQIKGGPGIIDKCIGLTGRGAVLTYTPANGHVGPDELRYTVAFPQSNGTPVSRDFYVRVLVRNPPPKKPMTDWTPAR